MLIQAYLGFVLLAALPAWSQVEPAATGGAEVAPDDVRMTTPPPVSGDAYPTVVGSEERSNYLNIGLTLTPAYNDNLVPGGSGKSVSDVSYMVLPTFALDRTTPRQRQAFLYSPGFTLYQRTSSLNAVDQSAALSFQYRLSPGATLNLRDSFLQTSNVFDQSAIFSGTGITGSTQTSSAAAIAPFAEQLSNMASGAISYQFSRNGMIGAGGSFSVLDFPNPAQAVGLYNSQASGGSAFYALRLSGSQYTGVAYQYTRIVANPPNARGAIQTHAFLPFYTFSLHRALSFSLTGGIERLEAAETKVPTFTSWSPSAGASVGWQISNFALAASYSRSITSGQGLLGAFTSNGVTVSGNWRPGRSWGIGLGMSYIGTTNAAPQLASSNQGGTSISGQASFERELSERFSAEFGYQRLHENYSGIAVISNDPDSDRAFASINYRFSRPIGR